MCTFIFLRGFTWIIKLNLYQLKLYSYIENKLYPLILCIFYINKIYKISFERVDN